MKNIESILVMEQLVFDKIYFNRTGKKNDKQIKYNFEIQIGRGKNNISKVTIILIGHKEDEYDLEISISGFFRISEQADISSEKIDMLLEHNAVAILMPYLRSEVSILTAQPNTDCVVLPPFNIINMMDKK